MLKSGIMLLKGSEKMEKNFCPFINGSCRSDCVFKMRCNTVTPAGSVGFTSCIIASKLADINEYQSDQLSEIQREISKEK